MANTRRTDSHGRISEKPAPKRKHVEEKLDEAIDDTFPASDPPAITQPGGQRVTGPEVRPQPGNDNGDAGEKGKAGRR